jgi:hypothetical protein
MKRVAPRPAFDEWLWMVPQRRRAQLRPYRFGTRVRETLSRDRRCAPIRAFHPTIGLTLLAASTLGCIPDSAGPASQAWSPAGKAAARLLPEAAGPPEACADREPLRRAFFGDLHVHTAWSFDAYLGELRTTPDDAYHFARGGEIEIPGGRRVALERPLDFAAVTDHAEWIAEVALCTRPESPVYASRGCAIFRGEARSRVPLLPADATRMSGIVGLGGRPQTICGEDLARCRATLASVWAETLAAAERNQDRTQACRFTTFPAYEYSYSPYRSKVHRNVVFRNAVVPELPASWIDAPTPLALWRKLQTQCLEAGTGCDVLAIPHNPNLSNGRMFTLGYRNEPLDDQRERAALRARLEPLVELMQVKGESECRSGLPGVLGRDELCDFEKLRGPTAALEPCARARRGAADRRQPLPLRADRQHRHPQRNTGRHRGAKLLGDQRRRGRQQRGSPLAGAVVRGQRHGDAQPGRAGRRVLGGELAGRTVRRDGAPRGVRHQWHAHRAASVRRLGLRARSVRPGGLDRPRLR